MLDQIGNMFGGMSHEQLMELAVGSGIIGQVKQKLDELIKGVAIKHGVEKKKVGLYLMSHDPHPEDPRQEPIIKLYIMVDGKRTDGYTIEQLLAEGKMLAGQ